MNIVTGKLYWPETLPAPLRYPSLTEDVKCDVLIIGGGEAGALVSYYLKQHEVDVILVDKRRISEGSSSANTGLLQICNDKTLTACIHSFGEQKGGRFYELTRQAVDELEQISGQLDLSPDYIRRDSLYYASEPADAESLRTEYELLKKYGFPVTYFERTDIEKRFSFSKAGAIYSKEDAELNPYKFTNGVIAHSVKKGMRVYENTEIVHQKVQDGGLLVYTKSGHTIKCRRAVFATGYEAQSMKRNANAVISSSFSIVTNPVDAFPGWPKACLIWETARPYLYIRTCPDGRIIVGGLDEPLNDLKKSDASSLKKRDHLLAKIQELFPQIPMRAEYYWGATFVDTHDGLPLFGEQEGYPHCLFTLGYGGNGTVYSTIGAQIISDLITKGSHSDADLFAFARKKYASVTV
ncbi:FAD-binding oxidoreductase [Brevibacillus sp. DP1.3A]|uniref:NAD(P)/FAD-dependent oxidoreductase n=1 Tax=Brevibacillus sp. DP1.3A TaxID=2738867 RepID=UPI00156B6004|nr:FAD-dependent oxidoreductase [Brevibacillus sp. DP1.3A]UED72623.1 FAD-binding oxidoreductase [Brevibacillus sp. DP1.3A]